jgi:putative ABC transport system permease protein
VTASISPPRVAYREDGQLRQLYNYILARTAAAPGISSAAIVSVLPLSGMIVNMNFGIEGQPPPRSFADAPMAGYRTVSPAYFETMGMRIVEGRAFTDADREDSEGVAIVNETLARRYWPKTSAVGKRVIAAQRPATIVGIVNDVRHSGPASPPEAELYLPLMQSVARSAWIVVKVEPGAGRAAGSLRTIVSSVDRNLPVSDIVPLGDLFNRNIAQTRFVAALLSGFSALATVLAVVGIYSVLWFAVSRRRRDIGVRMALGANRGTVLRLVLTQSLVLVAVGVAAGSVLAAGLSRFLRTLLFDVQPGDPLTIGGTAVLTIAAALAASYPPAHRAAHVDPVAALRED